MSDYNFTSWLIQPSTSHSPTALNLNVLNVIEIDGFREKWNRSRREVPQIIYNGIVFDWLESLLLPAGTHIHTSQLDEDLSLKDMFCLELANAIGSPEFLHHLLKSSSSYYQGYQDVDNNNITGTRSAMTIPPFGLGYLVSRENSGRGKLASFELLESLLGSTLRRVTKDLDNEEKTAVTWLYQDWLSWKRQNGDELELKPATSKDPQNLKRFEPEPELECVVVEPGLDSEPLVKRPRLDLLSGSKSVPPSRTRTTLMHWLNSATARSKAEKENMNILKSSGSPPKDPEDPEWICVESTSSTDPQALDSSIQLQSTGSLLKPPSLIQSRRLPEIPHLSSFHLSTYSPVPPAPSDTSFIDRGTGAPITGYQLRSDSILEEEESGYSYLDTITFSLADSSASATLSTMPTLSSLLSSSLDVSAAGSGRTFSLNHGIQPEDHNDNDEQETVRHRHNGMQARQVWEEEPSTTGTVETNDIAEVDALLSSSTFSSSNGSTMTTTTTSSVDAAEVGLFLASGISSLLCDKYDFLNST
ncbi:hypothetical protein BDP27DRAFT_1418709 [Rhodocollybia butyracea]|uniref:Uncharacterized protein n=1 Tax=Rhodocollybia butyracea TaxID=206335 RepID=A0A9P5UAC8_9AGAR|nr:hypothetical protein BDP27DRAFT_1418709 [Rhodocollybia butyracea]